LTWRFQRAAERAIDVVRRARFTRAGAVLVGGNQPGADRFERVGFRHRQRFERLPRDGYGTLRGRRCCGPRG